MADGAPDAKDVVGVKFEIVGDEVVMGFGADKECSPEVVADTNSRMHKEVGAVDVGAAAGSVSAIGGVVKQDRLATNPGHEVGTRLCRQAIGIDDIRVVQDRTIVLVPVVQTFFCAHCAFDIDSPTALGKVLQTGAGVGPTRFGRGNEGLGGRQGFGRPQGAAVEAEIDLLGMAEWSKRRERRREENRSQSANTSCHASVV